MSEFLQLVVLSVVAHTGAQAAHVTAKAAGETDQSHIIAGTERGTPLCVVAGVSPGGPPVGTQLYVKPPCVWPSRPPAGTSPFPRSPLLNGVTVLENATAIPHYGADTWYPAEDRYGNLYSGFDDGTVDNITVGSACTRAPDKCREKIYGFHTGSAVVSGDSWKSLSVQAVGGAIYEDGLPMQGRYTCANAVINGTWWVGTYGLAVGDGACESGTGVLQFCEMGPFIGFRTSIDGGSTWAEPANPTNGNELNVSNPLFAEVPGQAIKFGAPHVVDHGPENIHSPDVHNSLYMVANGCWNEAPNSNCSWISGDGVYLARATGFSAAVPGSLNDPAVWQYFCGSLDTGGQHATPSPEEECWTHSIEQAKPILAWAGRVGTVTATWHPGLARYLIAVTTPTVLPSTVGPYDTWILESPSLTAGPFSLVAYMPRFGEQAYFVSFPSRFLQKGAGKEAILAFSANFACKTGGCTPNIGGAGYGANLLPIRFG